MLVSNEGVLFDLKDDKSEGSEDQGSSSDINTLLKDNTVGKSSVKFHPKPKFCF